MTSSLLRTLPLLAALCGAANAQERAIAIQNARVLTMTGSVLEDATVVMRGGVIVDVGTRVDVPPGAEVIDANGGTLMPGLVSAYSRAGFSSGSAASPQPSRSRRRWRSRRSGGSPTKAANQAATKVADELYARQEIFGDLLRCGVTTLALRPNGKGFPGQGALLDPSATDAELTVSDEAFVVVAPANGTKNKDLIKDAFKKAAELIEERKKPAEPEKKKAEDDKPAPEKGADEKAKSEKKEAGEGEKNEAEKEGEKKKPTEEKAQEEDKKKPAEKKKADPNIEVLADLIQGKRRAFLEVSNASTLAHFLDAAGETQMPKRAIIAPSFSSREGRLDEVLDQLESWKAPILTSPTFTSPSYSRALINPAALLTNAGYEVGFILGDSERDIRGVFFQLIELVRHGLDRDAALAGVTRIPATALGIDRRVGSIEKGLNADLLLFDRDPLDPAARLMTVWHKGHSVEETE